MTGVQTCALPISTDLNLSLFDEFDADACLVIWDPDELARRMQRALERTGGGLFHHNPVEYFDPYDAQRHEWIDVCMSKDMCFAHQQEYRVIWLPEGAPDRLDPLTIDIGSIIDFADIRTAAELLGSLPARRTG